jgi:hypothetical protein
VLENDLMGAGYCNWLERRTRATCDLDTDDLADVEARVRGSDAEHLRNAPNIVTTKYVCMARRCQRGISR